MRTPYLSAERLNPFWPGHPATGRYSPGKKTVFLVFLLLHVSFCAFAASPFYLGGQAQTLSSLIHEDFSPRQTSLHRLSLHLNAGLQLPSGWSAHASLRNHLYLGQWLHDYPSLSFLGFNRFDWLHLNRTWRDDQTAMAFSRLDHAYVQYSGHRMQLRAGRQLISWGQTLIWNPCDIFNTYSLLEIDRPLRQGTDALRLAFYPAPTTVIEVVAKINHYKEVTAAAMLRFNIRGMDLHLQSGLVEDSQWMAGGSLSTHAGKTGLKSEWALFIPLRHHPTKNNAFILAAGADHVFSNRLVLQAEVLYNQMHYDETTGPLARIYRIVTSPNMLSLSKWSVSLNAIYPINDRLRIMVMTAAFTDDKMLFASPSLQWKWGRNTEMTAGYQYIQLEYRKENRRVRAGMLRLTHRF